MDNEIENRLKMLEDKVNKIIEAINDIEDYNNTKNIVVTWFWKSGYIDEKGNWVRGQFT